jgi:hypothetical protein
MSHQRVLTLYPYLLDGTCWVFDDERTGLKEEAFVLGMTEMISRAVDGKGVHDAAKGFALSFSDEPFDGPQQNLHLHLGARPGLGQVTGHSGRGEREQHCRSLGVLDVNGLRPKVFTLIVAHP